MSPLPNADATPQRRVLFVDDDPQFLATIRELMGALSAGTWQIETADGASRAFTVLQNQPMDLAVLDIQMNVMDGIQMLALLNRTYPNVQKAVLTGFPTEKYRAACLANGAELFLEKPRGREDWQNLYVALNTLMHATSDQGFRGVLRRVGLQDVLQMECLARNSSVLEIADRGQRGEIFLEDGSIIHAQIGELTGEEAFNRLLGLRGGQFNLKPFQEPAARTIEGPWEFLLMEAARKKDETDAALAAAAGEAAPVAALPLELAEAVQRTERTVSSPAGPRPAITQMLVCTVQGEVLHEWEMRNRSAWISFMEFLSQRASRLTRGLAALGEFDALEIETANERFVVALSAESGVFLRANSPGEFPLPVPASGNARSKEALTQWQRNAPPVTGELMRALRFPDQTFAGHGIPPELAQPTAEQAWRGLSDTFHVLAANRVPAERLVWQWQHGVLHCTQHADGTVFGILSTNGSPEADTTTIFSLLGQFRELS